MRDARAHIESARRSRELEAQKKKDAFTVQMVANGFILIDQATGDRLVFSQFASDADGLIGDYTVAAHLDAEFKRRRANVG